MLSKMKASMKKVGGPEMKKMVVSQIETKRREEQDKAIAAAILIGKAAERAAAEREAAELAAAIVIGKAAERAAVAEREAAERAAVAVREAEPRRWFGGSK